MTDPATRAARTLRDRFDREPTATASAPGRVNLIGGHTDYNDGFVLPVAIDRRTAVAATPRDDGALRATSTAFPDAATADLDALDPRGDWFDYVAGVAWALREAGHDVGGVDLAIHGDVPRGAGLSSSAALEVSVAGALRALWDLDVDDATLARTCQRAENAFVGANCGVMDQVTAAFGDPGAALFLDCRSLDREAIPFEGDARLVVVDTNVSHSHVDSGYNDRREACERGVDLLADRLPDARALRDVSPDEFDAHRDALPDRVAARCEHVVRENDRVQSAADALRAGDLARVGDLMVASHRSLRDRFEVSCRELDLVVDLATGVDGVLGARMTGGGFGGSVVCLVRPDAVESLRERVAADYPAETGVEADAYVCEPAGGLREEAVE